MPEVNWLLSLKLSASHRRTNNWGPFPGKSVKLFKLVTHWLTTMFEELKTVWHIINLKYATKQIACFQCLFTYDQ